MSDPCEPSHPPDICLLLRAYAEQKWLTTELGPLLDDLERGGVVREDELGAALAYLEVMWVDACVRARGTDAAHASLDPAASERCRVLHERAARYYDAVRRQRAELGARVRRLTHPEEPVGFRQAARG